MIARMIGGACALIVGLYFVVAAGKYDGIWLGGAILAALGFVLLTWKRWAR